MVRAANSRLIPDEASQHSSMGIEGVFTPLKSEATGPNHEIGKAIDERTIEAFMQMENGQSAYQFMEFFLDEIYTVDEGKKINLEATSEAGNGIKLVLSPETTQAPFGSIGSIDIVKAELAVRTGTKPTVDLRFFGKDDKSPTLDYQISPEGIQIKMKNGQHPVETKLDIDSITPDTVSNVAENFLLNISQRHLTKPSGELNERISTDVRSERLLKITLSAVETQLNVAPTYQPEYISQLKYEQLFPYLEEIKEFMEKNFRPDFVDAAAENILFYSSDADKTSAENLDNQLVLLNWLLGTDQKNLTLESALNLESKIITLNAVFEALAADLESLQTANDQDPEIGKIVHRMKAKNGVKKDDSQLRLLYTAKKSMQM